MILFADVFCGAKVVILFLKHGFGTHFIFMPKRILLRMQHMLHPCPTHRQASLSRPCPMPFGLPSATSDERQATRWHSTRCKHVPFRIAKRQVSEARTACFATWHWPFGKPLSHAAPTCICHPDAPLHAEEQQQRREICSGEPFGGLANAHSARLLLAVMSSVFAAFSCDTPYVS